MLSTAAGSAGIMAFDEVMQFRRLWLDGLVFHSMAWCKKPTRQLKRNSCIVVFQKNVGIGFGEIQFFLYATSAANSKLVAAVVKEYDQAIPWDTHPDMYRVNHLVQYAIVVPIRN